MVQAQSILSQRKVTELPAILRESSSLVCLPEGRFWSLNDGGNRPFVYAFDTTGRLLDSLRVRPGRNTDWESMAMDAGSGRLFVGDTGDNLNQRDSLTIYVVNSNERDSSYFVTPQLIRFVYPNRPAQQPGVRQCAFDCEALVYSGNYLYLFSKSRCAERYTKCYRLPAQPGLYEAELLDSFLLPHWVTSADISPDGKRLALLCETRLWIFEGFEGDHFFSGQMTELKLGVWTQKEGVAWLNERELYFTDETTLVDKGTLTHVILDW